MSAVRRSTVAGYALADVLDSDLVSTTYRASHAATGRAARLRVVSAPAGVDATSQRWTVARDELIGISLSAGAIDHAAIVAVLDAGVDGDRAYVATADLAATVLRDRLARHGRLEPTAVTAIGYDVAGALDAAHAAGVVHGSINPHSIVVDSDARTPRARLDGFGAAKVLGLHVDGRRRAPVADDLLYVAPEQVRTREPSPLADRYALACAVYHLITGRPPFARDTIAALFGAHLFSTATAPSVVHPRLAPTLDMVMRRALDKDTARFDTAAAFMAAVDRALHGGTVPSAPARNGTVRSAADQATSPRSAGAVAASSPAANGHTAVVPPTDTLVTPPAEAAAPVAEPAEPAAPDIETATPFSDLVDVPGRRRRWRGRAAWAAVLLLGLLAAAVALVAADRFPGGRDSAVRDQPAADVAGAGQQRPRVRVRANVEPTVVAPVWTATVGQQDVTAIARTGDAVVTASGTTISMLDRASGDRRWRATVAAPVTSLVVLDRMIIAGTAGGPLYGLDPTSGRRVWQSPVDGRLAALTAGRGQAYAAVLRDEQIEMVTVAADDGATDTIAVADAADDDPDTLALAFDRSSKQDGRLLYLLTDAALSVYDPGRAEADGDGAPRSADEALVWRASRSAAESADTPARLAGRPWVESLGAVAGAGFVIDRDGNVCRHEARDGTPVWTFCPTFPADLTRAPDLFARRALVVVSSRDALVAYDYTNGLQQWNVTLAEPLEGPVAGSGTLVYVPRGDGTLRALDHESGLERWRAADLDGVTAVTADEDGVLVGRGVGRVAALPLRP